MSTEVTIPDEVQMASAVAQAYEGYEVVDGASLVVATDALVTLKEARVKTESARVFLVKPLNDHVATINKQFKPHLGALDSVIAALKAKVVRFHHKRQEDERAAVRAAAELMGSSEEVTEIATSVVVPTRARTASGAVQVAQRWNYEAVDMRALCAAIGRGDVNPDLIQVNRGVVRTWMNAMVMQKQTPELPGIRFYKEDGVSVL